MPTRRSITAAGDRGLRCTRSCRASVARFSSRMLRTRSATHVPYTARLPACNDGGRPAAQNERMQTRRLVVRACAVRDLERINEIYNHYVRTSPATFDLDERSLEWRRGWFAQHATPRHR